MADNFSKAIVMGIDISINHGAFVVLEDGVLAGYRFVTDRKTVADKSKGAGMYMPAAKLKDAQERGVVRIAFWSQYLATLLNNVYEYVGIEDYAYRAAMNAHQIGEIGGMVRLRLWKAGCKIRLHDPGSVKMFAAHDGTADKDLMVATVRKRWPETEAFARHSEGSKYVVIEEDLCDAYAIAQLVWTEVQLRRGELQMSQLLEKEVRVFNRCTKRWPTSVLGRDWLHRDSEVSSVIPKQ